MLLGEKNINAIVSTFCSSSTSQTDGDSTSTLICKRKAKNFGIPPKPFDERSFDKNVDCCNKENVNIDFPSSTLTSPLMKLPGLNDCAKCQKYEEMFTKLKEITKEDNDHHGKYSSVRKILNTLSTERSISPVYDTNLLSNTRVDKNLIKMIENDQESNEKVIEVDSFTKNSDLVHIDCVIEKGQGDIKDICSKPSSNCYVRNNSKHLNSQIEKNKSLLSREEKTTIHPLFIHNTIKENFDTSTPLRRSKRRSSASHIPTYYGENRSTTKTKKIVETDGSEKKPLRRRSSRRQTMSTVYVPPSAQSVKVTTRIARDDLQTRTSMLSLDKNDEKPSQSKRRKNLITCSLPIIQKKISENTPNVTKELDPQEAIATSIARDDLQIRTNILSLDKNDEKLVQSKRRRNSIACSLPIFKKIKSESIPNVAKEFDSRDIITPSKNSSDLSCRRKIPTIDDLSTSSGDERKRESNIAYDSSSDIDNNNNKDKRRTEQRRRTMAVNGSSPLLGKDRFLESQDSLFSSNSSSSEKECHVATNHTIVMKGKKQDFEERKHLSYRNSFIRKKQIENMPTPPKKLSDLSSLRKIPTIDDLSTSSGDERKRESNIAYDSSSDIDNNNNKDKRRTEQRRRTMAVNDSSPLLAKDRFLESQDSLCSSNSSSSGRKCNVATDHTIVMKGKKQDVERLTSSSFHNSFLKKNKSENMPKMAKEFDPQEIITPTKNSSDLSSLRKIPTIDDLSTSSGDERKRESNIAYDSSSDIDNNNNKDKRRTEQRRRTMAVNGSSPLLGKDRFLESQDSLCSSNSSSSEKECHIATDHTIVMKGKEQDIEELTNLSYHNSSEGSLIDDIKEPKCYEHRKVVDHDEKKIVRRATHHSCVPEEESKPRSSSLKISSLSNFSSPSTLSEYTVSTAFLVEKISPVEHSTDKMTRSHECKPTNSLSKNYEDTLDRNLNKIKAYGSQQNDFTSFNKDIPQASPKRVVSLPNPNIKSENSKSSSTVRTKRRSHRIRMTPKRYHDEKMMVESELPTTGSQNILSESRLSQNGTSFISTSIILPENTVAGNKRGKRRRRSLRLHVGGMINEDDIEQIEKETNARKLKRNLDLARNKENRATIYSKVRVRVRVRVNGEVDENELLSMQHVQKKENNTSLNKLGKIELQSGKHISEYKNMGNDYHTRPRSHQRQVEDGSVQPSSSLYDKLEIVKTKETFQENIEECKSNESGKIKENIIKQSQPVPTSDILYSVSKDRNGISESEKSCKYNRLIPSPALKKNFRWTKVSSDKALILRQNKSTKSLIKKKSAVRTSIGSTIIPSVDDIKDRISDLFGDSNVLKKACVSARLFAFVSILVERKYPSVSKHGRILSMSYAIEMKGILPLLRSLVEAEIASLVDEDSEQSSMKKTKTFCCSFDFSSTMPPVDTVKGSNHSLENLIKRLQLAVIEMNDIIPKLCSEQDTASYLSKFISTLKDFESNHTTTFAEICAESMPVPWSPVRFLNAAGKYRFELENLFTSISNSGNNSDIRRKLGTFLANVIRYYLRKFFNPVPYALTTPSEKHPHVVFSGCRSHIHRIIEMVDDTGCGRDTATADGSIASVIGLVLPKIHAFYELRTDKKLSTHLSYTNQFCNRPASKRGLEHKGLNIILTEIDVDEIIKDIHEAHIVLSGVRGCIFIQKLMNWPGVSEAIEAMGGWDKIESFANIFSHCKLDKACPDEKFISLLSCMKSFIKKVTDEADDSQKMDLACEDSLKRLWKRFRCGSSNKKILKRNPGILTIRAYLEDGKSIAFPSFISTSDEG